MILDGKMLKRLPFSDSRGESGMSGKLHIAETPDGIKYLVKRNPVDVANEYVAHSLAKLIGVPTSDAVLIKEQNGVSVGIAYENDFKHVSMDDFLGTVEYDDGPSFLNGEVFKPKIPTEAKYPDDDPLLAEVMAYLSFRRLIVLEDNPQLAFAGGHLISFDYAESFRLDDRTFGMLMNDKGLSYCVNLYGSHLFLKGGFNSDLSVLHRPKTDFLLDAYVEPLFAFQEANFQPIFDDLDAVFPILVSAFYAACFEGARRVLEKMGE